MDQSVHPVELLTATETPEFDPQPAAPRSTLVAVRCSSSRHSQWPASLRNLVDRTPADERESSLRPPQLELLMNNPGSPTLLPIMSLPTTIPPLSEHAAGSADAHCTKCPGNLKSILSSQIPGGAGERSESNPYPPRPSRMSRLRAD